MKKYLILIAMLGIFQSGFSQDRGNKMMERLEAQKVAFFTQTLDLSVEESQAFWPIYNDYQERQKTLRKEYKMDVKIRELNDEQATQVISNHFELEEKQLDLKKMLYSDLREAIPPRKIVRLQYAEKQFKQKLLDQIKERREKRKNKR